MATGLTLLAQPAKTTEPASLAQTLAMEPKAADSPVPSETKLTATTNAVVYLRDAQGTNSNIITALEQGAVVTLEDGGDANWQEVTYASWRGYIYRAYLKY